MKDTVPRVKLENLPMIEEDRFKLTLTVRDITLNGDGSLHVWLDKPDVNNLHLDCSAALLDDDLSQGDDKVPHELCPSCGKYRGYSEMCGSDFHDNRISQG